MQATTIPEPTFAEYARLRPLGIRAIARSLALSAMASASEFRGTINRALARPRVQFVYLHHVFRDEEAAFRRLLDALTVHHAFIGHSEAVDRVRNDQIDRPYISFSFDDGFADNDRAARVLEEFGTRGCFFVCPAIVGERDPEKLAAFCAQRLEFPTVTPFLDWTQLERLIDRGHEVGGHTMTHPNLATTPPDEALREIHDSYVSLTHRLGNVRHFAWPRGRWDHMPPAARDAVFGAGYSTCSSAVRGCHVVGAHGPVENLCIRRDHVLANWPLGHIRYLLMRNALSASAASNEWPAMYPRVA